MIFLDLKFLAKKVKVALDFFFFKPYKATHSSILAWKSPWTEEPGGLQSMGLHDWACVHEGGGRWIGSNEVVQLKTKKKPYKEYTLILI